MRGLRVGLLAVSLCASTGISAQPAPIFGDLGEPAWSRMYKFIEQKLGSGASDDIVEILPSATNAAWNDPLKPIRLMEMYKWGDWMPPASWQYAPDASKRVSDGYRYFIKSALLYFVASSGTASASLKDAVTRSTEDLDFERENYNTTVAKADAEYDKYAASHPRPRKTKTAYLHDQSLDVQIAAAKKRLDGAAADFTLISSQIQDPDIDLLKTAYERYNNPLQQIYLPPVREVVNDPDLWQKYYVSLLDKDIFAFMKQSVPQTEDVSESQSSSEVFDSQWHAELSVKFLGLFRAGGASADEETHNEQIRNNTTRIVVSFANLDTFNVVRGEWYSANVIDNFSSKLPPDVYTHIFGHNGQLEIIPKAILVGRGMKFSIYADSSTLDYMYHHFQANADAGIRIGWFSVGGSGGYSETHQQTKVTEFSDHIEYQDLSGQPKVIAVLAKRYGANPAPAAMMAEIAAPSATARQAANSRLMQQWIPSAVLKASLKDATPEVKAAIMR